jgi:hypothetical protein
MAQLCGSNSTFVLFVSSSANCVAAYRRNHFQEIAGQLIDNSFAVGHGHAVGHSGAGHQMPQSDAHKQDGAYIPQSVFAKDGGVGFDDPGQDDYGTVNDRSD